MQAASSVAFSWTFPREDCIEMIGRALYVERVPSGSYMHGSCGFVYVLKQTLYNKLGIN